MDNKENYHIHLISDSTGETLNSLMKACLVQFADVDYKIHSWPLIRSRVQLNNILENHVKDINSVILYTIIETEFQQVIDNYAFKHHYHAISVLSPLIDKFSKIFNKEMTGKSGLQYQMDDQYFDRIDAMQYTLSHDDGKNTDNLDQADIIVIGVSRTSKTPVSIYLANRGLRVANFPYVPSIPLPEEIFKIQEQHKAVFIIGLTQSVDKLIEIRKSRLHMMADYHNKSYIDLDNVKEEIQECKIFCRRQGWHVIDVSKKSIEETAATIVSHYERARGG